MRLGHRLGQILPIVQNASAASTVTGGFCLFSQVSLPGSEILDPGSSREFPGIPTPGNSHFRSLAYYIYIPKSRARAPTAETSSRLGLGPSRIHHGTIA